MSQPPRNRPPSRQVPSRPGQGSRSQAAGSRPQGGPPPRERDYYDQPPSRYAPPRNGGNYRQRPRYVQPQRDPFPYIMGGIIGAMVVGLVLVIFLLINSNKGGTATSTTNNTNSGVVPGATSVVSSATQAPSGDTPPRMPLDEFKALYDNPAKRPMIIDVRVTDAYTEGHILGAVSMPEPDIDAIVGSGKIPKDKLVVAYCQ